MYVPEWAQEGGTDRMLERLADPDTRERMRPEVDEVLRHRGWNQLLLHSLSSERYRGFTGKTVQEIAEAEWVDPFDLACDILIQEGGRAPFMGMFGLEEDIRTLMRHEAVMIGSDGTAMSPGGPKGGGPVHPRNYGTFARVIETYIGGGVLSLPEGVHKMSGMAAWRLGLRDRGIIAPGAYADITVFDPNLVREKYTLTEAPGFPKGIPYVIVNGVITIDNSEHTGARAGKVIHNPHVNDRS
jgi:N-acyl-D-amino-acid deacylase